jgi:hypothetical protein
LVAIREVLTEIQAGVSHPINEVLQHLARRLPVLEGGAYRKGLDRLLSEQPDPAVRAGHVGSGISQSLLILEATGLLRLEFKADVERAHLQHHEDNVMEVSHVVLISEAAA